MLTSALELWSGLSVTGSLFTSDDLSLSVHVCVCFLCAHSGERSRVAELTCKSVWMYKGKSVCAGYRLLHLFVIYTSAPCKNRQTSKQNKHSFNLSFNFLVIVIFSWQFVFFTFLLSLCLSFFYGIYFSCCLVHALSLFYYSSSSLPLRLGFFKHRSLFVLFLVGLFSHLCVYVCPIKFLYFGHALSLSLFILYLAECLFVCTVFLFNCLSLFLSFFSSDM